ncbi:MAG: holo-ACP synthase [Eubacteriales bacterium]
MVLGLGIDVVKVRRMRDAVLKEGFLKRVYTEKEIELFNSRADLALTAASNFAAKEAVIKALALGMSRTHFNEIEVLRKTSGQPYAVLYGNAKEAFLNMQGKNLIISITNTEDSTAAVAVIEG